MVDIGVALTWIAISAASARGLSALARAAVASDIVEQEPLLNGSAASFRAHTGSSAFSAAGAHRLTAMSSTVTDTPPDAGMAGL
jgi:hypothetical protein